MASSVLFSKVIEPELAVLRNAVIAMPSLSRFDRVVYRCLTGMQFFYDYFSSNANVGLPVCDFFGELRSLRLGLLNK